MAATEQQRRPWWRLKPDSILLCLMILSVIVGVALGAGLKVGGRQFTSREVMQIGFVGDVFLRMLKMLILPLIVTSLINSLTTLNPRTAGRLGGVTILYFLITTILAVIEGIVLVLTIGPGYYADGSAPTDYKAECESAPSDTILDLIRNFFPDNLVQACFQSVRSCVIRTNKTVYHNYTDDTGTHFSVDYVEEETVKVSYVDGMNILGLVCAAFAYGIVVSLMGPQGKTFSDLSKVIESATMRLVSAVIWFGPIGIVFLIAKEIIQMDDPVKEVQGLGMYIITVLAGIALHSLIILPVMYFIFVRKNPLKHFSGVFQALMTALGTDSSSATLPVTIKCMEENNGCDPRIARFVLPLGATINMNGTALYEAVAALYVSQVKGVPMSAGKVVIVSVTATLAAIGAAGIPQAGLVTLIMVLTAVGLPPEYSALIIPVDWFLDRFRTTANVFGDTVGAAIVQRYCGDYVNRLSDHATETEGPHQAITTLSTSEIDKPIVKKNGDLAYPSKDADLRL